MQINEIIFNKLQFEYTLPDNVKIKIACTYASIFLTINNLGMNLKLNFT